MFGECLSELPPDLKAAIEAFERLSEEYADAGAADSEPEAMFHGVIRCAVEPKPFEWDRLDWHLFDHAGAEPDQRRRAAEAKPKLTAAARQVYTLATALSNDRAAVEALRAYAWRPNYGWLLRDAPG